MIRSGARNVGILDASGDDIILFGTPVRNLVMIDVLEGNVVPYIKLRLTALK